MLLECLSVRVRGSVFSRFDVFAACGTSFLKNLTMTIVLPVVLSSAEASSSRRVEKVLPLDGYLNTSAWCLRGDFGPLEPS